MCENKKKQKTAALHNLGCKVNAYETEAMQQLLEEAGYNIVPFQDVADVYVINTCTVTNIADRKSRQMIHKARKKNPEAIVVAAGCYVQTASEDSKIEGTADILLGNNHKSELIERIGQFAKEHRRVDATTEIAAEQSYETLSISDHVPENVEEESVFQNMRTHTRAFLKVQDGCNQFCSYCLIPYARGRIRSRELEDVVQEVKRLVKGGTKEVVLTGIHLSSYGSGTEDGLIDLIERVNEIDGIERIRIGSIEQGIITEEFLDRLVQCEKFCPHFHLSLQSGCDATLQRMNRHYTAAQFAEKCALIRSKYDHPALTTDVITGFPGETDEEFEQTYEFLKQIRFYETHIFRFSPRSGTKAAKMPGQIDESVKVKRSERLIALGKEYATQYREYYVGKTVQVLTEEKVYINEKEYITGYTKEYVKAVIDAEKAAVNTVIETTGKGLQEGEFLLL